MTTATTAPSDPKDPLTHYWRRPVEDVATVENTTTTAAENERHTILSLLVMALASDAWNGNKHGAVGDYPWRQKQKIPGTNRYLGNSYLGHNIVCLAVDARGAIIDFDFNHNEIYNSSVEHAEARLVRRIFNLNQNYDHWQTTEPGKLQDVPYTTTLSGVTIYTSLESCAQCSGIMALANVKSVIYLQSDPGQYRIGNILYNLSNPLAVSHPVSGKSPAGPSPTKYGAPEPINAGEVFGFRPKRELDAAYGDFVKVATANPDTKYFFRSTAPGVAADTSTSITSFLCCDVAKDIFDQAAATLQNLNLEFGSFAPTLAGGGDKPFTNQGLLEEARKFRQYVAVAGRRGTPHK